VNILGIDPSIVCTGWCLLNTEKGWFRNGEIKSKNKDVARLLDIENGIKDQLIIKIQLAVMERMVYSPHYGHASGNLELEGILKRLFYIEEVPLVLVSPPTLKKFVTGSGKSQKNEILRAAYQKWNISASEHIVEALALARIGEMILKKDNKEYIDNLKKYEKEVLKTLLKKEE